MVGDFARADITNQTNLNHASRYLKASTTSPTTKTANVAEVEERGSSPSLQRLLKANPGLANALEKASSELGNTKNAKNLQKIVAKSGAMKRGKVFRLILEILLWMAVEGIAGYFGSALLTKT
ncbi:unnamed protein product [Phytophthora lilii]|uniref:Unnamed protein product n=1 Tax=Phytophthora lilii TaxID=2077276 RepID=A0A9W6TES5_9STRA|nr:unnamed protein product [Phytophthora lilii]